MMIRTRQRVVSSAAVALVVLTFASTASAAGHRCESTTSSGVLYAGKTTSCAFARRAEKYINARGLPRQVRIKSPVTGKRYTLHRVTKRSSPSGYRYKSRSDPGLWLREVY